MADSKLVGAAKPTAWTVTFDRARVTLWPVVGLRLPVWILYAAMFIVCVVALSYTYLTLKGAFIEFMQTNVFTKIGSMR